MAYENWKIGKGFGCIITDSEEGYPPNKGFTGSDAVEYYGGNLVCESVGRKKDLHLIAAAPKMLEALQNLENDADQIPDHAWKMIQEAINAATNDMQYNPLAQFGKPDWWGKDALSGSVKELRP